MVSDLADRVAGLRLPRLEPQRRNVRLGCLVILYLVFLVVGAAIFSAIEAPVEVAIVRSTRRMKKEFLALHPCVTESALEDLVTEVVIANNRGVSSARNASSGSNWSFGQSLFFSATVVTTIGYGHVTPLSEGGKLFCIVFALIGIPLTLVILSAFVERLMVPSTLTLQPFNIRLVHLTLVGALIAGVFLLLPAVIFNKVEPGWSFLDSVYYCFISLTTVGLGDYIPGDRPGQEYRPLYKVAITGYLLVGLVMMMWFLTVFAEIPQLNFGILFLHQSDDTTSDPEKMRLSGSAVNAPKYTQQMENHVKVSSRPVQETPSPEETTPVHARQK